MLTHVYLNYYEIFSKRFWIHIYKYVCDIGYPDVDGHDMGNCLDFFVADVIVLFVGSLLGFQTY